MESQVFESTSERDRGERSIEDVESRLALFARRVGEGGFKFHMTGSRNALERFLELNVKVMNIKKVNLFPFSYTISPTPSLFPVPPCQRRSSPQNPQKES